MVYVFLSVCLCLSLCLSASLSLSLMHVYIYITDILECIICTVHFMLNNIDVSPSGMIQSNTVEYIEQYILCNIARVMCIHSMYSTACNV